MRRHDYVSNELLNRHNIKYELRRIQNHHHRDTEPRRLHGEKIQRPVRPIVKRAAITLAAVAPPPAAPLMVGASGFETSPIANANGTFVSWLLSTTTYRCS